MLEKIKDLFPDKMLVELDGVVHAKAAAMPVRLKALQVSSDEWSTDDDDTPGKQADSEEPRKRVNGGGWFYVNKSGFPLSEFAWERMWKFATSMNPDAEEIRELESVPDVPVPRAPLHLPSSLPVSQRLEAVQKYLLKLQYNHTGTQFFDIRKNRPFSGLMESARDMIRDSLPIKCLEAVVLAIYLTNSCKTLDRFPVSFNTICNGNVHRHVVLCVCFNGKYGALGLSRRQDLMYKPLVYDSLSALVMNFYKCYQNYGHLVKKVKIGLCAPHDPRSYESLSWSAYSFDLQWTPCLDWCREIEKCSRRVKTESAHWHSGPCEYHAPKPPTSAALYRKRRSSSLSSLTLATNNKIKPHYAGEQKSI